MNAPPPTAPLVSVQGLTYRFRGADRPALAGVDLRIDPGDFVVVTGPSGCGKSTLALALGGFLFRQYEGEAAGSVTVAGMDVRTTPIYDVADVVGLVQQNPEAQFCTLTVEDEVAFGLENRRLPRAEIRQRLAWALEMVGAAHLRRRALATLSGGEKQKVAVAAVMAARPRLLIFDEPTSNLDPTATAEIFDVIARIRKREAITVVVIEHKSGYLRRFDPRWVRMEAGAVVDGATPPPGPPLPCAAPAPQQASPVVQVAGLRVDRGGRPVLRDITLQIGAGEFVAVMGDNGSGKSTFLHALMGFLAPEAGRVTVLGHNLAATAPSALARDVGFLFQNPEHQLFAETVWQEAAFAPQNFGLPPRAYRARTEALLARAGLAGREENHPYRLSYGEKRRLNLISVLNYAPRLLLLDEVLIGQDPANAAFVLGQLRDYVAGGGTAILVNHAPEVTRACADRLLFFEAGRVVVDAPPEAAFEQLAAGGRRVYLPEARHTREVVHA